MFSKYISEEINVFPEVEETIAILRKNNIKIAFNTGYNREMAVFILAKVGYEVGIDIDILVTASDVENHRPKPGYD